MLYLFQEVYEFIKSNLSVQESSSHPKPFDGINNEFMSQRIQHDDIADISLAEFDTLDDIGSLSCKIEDFSKQDEANIDFESKLWFIF